MSGAGTVKVALSRETATEDPREPTSRIVRREPLPLGMGKKAVLGANPTVALLLAILVGFVVFVIFWRVRKTFGMKD